MHVEAGLSRDVALHRAGQSPAEWRRLRHDLRQAAHAGGFTLLFQPRQDLATGLIIGGATQLRWPRRRGGLTASRGFMPLLDAYGLAADVAAWAMNAACQEAAAWPHGNVSLTADPGCLRDGTLLRQVGHALTASGLAPGRLEVAVSEETLAAESEDILFTLAALRDRGVATALEGFGAEQASLVPLKRMPLTAVILDRTIVRELPDDAEAAAIVLATTRFARALDLRIVACGVETAAQRGFLHGAGCHEAQGSLCGHVVASADMARLFIGG